MSFERGKPRPIPLDFARMKPVKPDFPRDHVLACIGNTPLLRLQRVSPKRGVAIFGKAEWFNAGGSVKDRPALFMVLEGIQSGRFTKDKTLIDPTSGNTGISYALICAALGYRCKLVLPANATEERKKTLRALGAEIELTDADEGQDGAIEHAHALAEADPERYFMPNQYDNPYNAYAHWATTGPEIWEQSKGKVTHFVGVLGTAGTVMGTGRRLKESNPKVKVIGVEPDSGFHGIEGAKHMPTAIVPALYHPEWLDETVRVSTEDAIAWTRRLAREEGLFVGTSSGAAVAAAVRLAEKLDSGTIVTVFPDAGTKYLSTRLFD